MFFFSLTSTVSVHPDDMRILSGICIDRRIDLGCVRAWKFQIWRDKTTIEKEREDTPLNQNVGSKTEKNTSRCRPITEEAKQTIKSANPSKDGVTSSTSQLEPHCAHPRQIKEPSD
ncbi:hypothetical protein NPIL_554061 [Nephila pilipes]|uniref:Uncharacterized protein n=1 Tax=Nephila pilipes TaxID=299642 RepID=A0A8X6QBZ8_NEPPI|nr:hypothetical protein NPIL_554061 [Nephila pilipes]